MAEKSDIDVKFAELFREGCNLMGGEFSTPTHYKNWWKDQKNPTMEPHESIVGLDCKLKSRDGKRDVHINVRNEDQGWLRVSLDTDDLAAFIDGDAGKAKIDLVKDKYYAKEMTIHFGDEVDAAIHCDGINGKVDRCFLRGTAR